MKIFKLAFLAVFSVAYLNVSCIEVRADEVGSVIDYLVEEREREMVREAEARRLQRKKEFDALLKGNLRPAFQRHIRGQMKRSYPRTLKVLDKASPGTAIDASNVKPAFRKVIPTNE